MSSEEPILEVKNLEKHFTRKRGLTDLIFRNQAERIHAVDGVSFSLGENETIGVIGESGCGKSTLLNTLIGLLDPTDGEIIYNGESIQEYSRKEWTKYRQGVQIIFQDPFDSLDPKMTVKETLKEPLDIHNIGNKEERIREILTDVQLSPPDRYLHRVPQQLSGGEKQRVSIARALVVEPDLILADEPVSMLDVSTQASVLRMLSDIIDEHGLSMIYISHDLSTVSYVCDEVNVMYLGRIVERSPTKKLIDDPKHPYTEALINAIPVPDPTYDRERTTIKGYASDPINIGEGCRFRDRCPERMDICEKTPRFITDEEDNSRKVACHLYYEHEEDKPGAQEPVRTDGNGMN